MNDALSNKQVKRVVGDRAEYLVFTAFEKYPELGAAFAIRGSKAYHYEPSAPNMDYSGISSELGLDKDNIIIPFQEHTANVAEYNSEVREYISTDGLVTRERGVVLGTKVADCISLLFYDPVRHAIGNIHSGWRGTLQKIALNGVAEMAKKFGTNPTDLICVMCPSIRQDHFEVDTDVYEQFKGIFPQIIDEITIPKNSKYYIDTVRCNSWMLEQVGMRPDRIIDCGLCTVCHSGLINSFRGNQDNEKHYRNLALIWLKS